MADPLTLSAISSLCQLSFLLGLLEVGWLQTRGDLPPKSKGNMVELFVVEVGGPLC